MPETVPVADDSAAHDTVRTVLLDRRRRLGSLPSTAVGPKVLGLISEVDAALERLETPAFGVCEVCHEHMSSPRLLADPLATVCLECLGPADRQALERDLEMASQVQAALLPPREIAGPGWRGRYAYHPFGPVSGDHVDVLPYDDGMLVVVGDVAGKGLAAALLMSQLHAMFRALAAPDLALEELLRRVNALLAAATTGPAYATLAAARLRPGGRVQLSCAGHAPPLAVRASGVEALAADGVPLGLFPTSTFGSQELVLEPGEALLLYTDGLSESSAEDDTELGLDGLLRGIGTAPFADPEELVRRCVETAEVHRGGMRAHDDLTVLALQRTDEP